MYVCIYMTIHYFYYIHESCQCGDRTNRILTSPFMGATISTYEESHHSWAYL